MDQPEWEKRGYRLTKEIGQGSFGKVFCAQKTGDPRSYAIKVIDNVNSYMISDIQQEVDAMKKIKGSYTLSLIDDFYDAGQLQYILITEYLGGGDLSQKISQRKGNWSLQEIVALTAQIALAFVDMIRKEILHRDLKPENILIDEKGFYKVCDFGCAKFIDISASKFLMKSKPFGTQLYNSPEVYNGEDYNSTADVWSLGVILYVIVYGKYHLKVDSDLMPNIDHFMQICRMERTIEFPKKEGLHPQLLALMKGMLEVKKDKRFRWADVVEHLHNNFHFVIDKGQQLLSHQISLSKILCEMVEILAEERTTKELLQVGLEKKVKSKVTNVLIMLQYDELVDAELALKKCGIYRGAFLMPHLASEERDDRVFRETKKKSAIFREMVPPKMAIDKLRDHICEESAALKSRLEEALTSKGSQQAYPNLLRIVKALAYLLNYAALSEPTNNDRLSGVFQEMFAK